MCKFFFHVINGKADVDVVGVELASMDAMRSAAVRSAGEMIAGDDQTWQGDEWQMIVTDENRTVVFGVRFSTDRHGQ